MRTSAYASPVPAFWYLQSGGWLLYCAAIAAVSIPFRHEIEYVAYRSTFLFAGFLCSFIMYAVCHANWRRKASLMRSLLFCTGVSSVLGVLCSAAAVWVEAHLTVTTTAFRWAPVFVNSPGGAFVLIAWSAFYFGIKHYQELEEQRAKLMASESLAREAQLQALRYQLQPHFLFNTLNAISTLVLDNQPRLATQMIAKLGDLLRSTLDAPDIHQVSLAEELTVEGEYLAIEQVRFGHTLAVSFEIAPGVREAQVPRFLLQPLVENAIRHGISKRKTGGQISIRVKALEGDLRISVENEGVAPIAMAPLSRRGLGLVNTRARLEQLYGSAASMQTTAKLNGDFEVAITIPLSFSAQTTSDRPEQAS